MGDPPCRLPNLKVKPPLRRALKRANISLWRTGIWRNPNEAEAFF